MVSLSNFYNNMFAIEIAVYGIIAAAMFVFVQMFHAQFSYRQIGLAFKNVWLVLYVALSTLTMIFTAAASLELSLPSHDFLPWWDVGSRALFVNEFIPLFLLIVFFASIMLCVVFVIQNLRYLRPSRILLLIGESIREEDIKNFLLGKFGIPLPSLGMWMYKQKNLKTTTVFDSDLNELRDDNDNQICVLKKIEQDKELAYKEYEEVKNKSKDAPDPFEPISAMLVIALRKGDIGILNDVCELLVKISKRFLDSIELDINGESWNPYSEIGRRYIENVCEFLWTHMQIAEKQYFDLGRIKMLEVSKRIAEHIVKKKEFLEIKAVLDFWKKVGDDAIERRIDSFVYVITYYDGLCDKAFQEGIKINQQWIDEIFRHLGWLGERLFSKQEIEDEPIMIDDYRYPIHNRLLDVLLSYSDKYDSECSDSYPLIYFDAIIVVLSRLLTLYKQKNLPIIKNSIFSCIGVYSSFAERAVYKGNDNGVALAVVRLKESYDRSLEERIDDVARYTIAELTSIAAHVAINRSTLSGHSFLSQPIDEYIIDILKESDFSDTIAREIREVYMKQVGNNSTIWDFITHLGKQLQTNFGFMFDWQTGQNYAADDPRRH